MSIETIRQAEFLDEKIHQLRDNIVARKRDGRMNDKPYDHRSMDNQYLTQQQIDEFIIKDYEKKLAELKKKNPKIFITPKEEVR